MSKCKKCVIGTAIVVGATLTPSAQGNNQFIQELKVKDSSMVDGNSAKMKNHVNDDELYALFNDESHLPLSGEATRRRLKKKNCVIL